MKKFMILSLCFVFLLSGCVQQSAKPVATTSSSSLFPSTTSTTQALVSTTTSSTSTTSTQVSTTTTMTSSTSTTTTSTTLAVSEEDLECDSYCKHIEYPSGVCRESRVECRNNKEFSPAIYVKICAGITDTCCCRYPPVTE